MIRVLTGQPMGYGRSVPTAVTDQCCRQNSQWPADESESASATALGDWGDEILGCRGPC
jgi:hypothetical protein